MVQRPIRQNTSKLFCSECTIVGSYMCLPKGSTSTSHTLPHWVRQTTRSAALTYTLTYPQKSKQNLQMRGHLAIYYVYMLQLLARLPSTRYYINSFLGQGTNTIHSTQSQSEHPHRTEMSERKVNPQESLNFQFKRDRSARRKSSESPSSDNSISRQSDPPRTHRTCAKTK